jgi:hypothetical protein
MVLMDTNSEEGRTTMHPHEAVRITTDAPLEVDR